MTIPISYNLRNLVVRRNTSLFTIFGVALTVAVLVAVMGLVGGLKHAFSATGHPDHLLVLRKGSTSELVSSVSRDDYQVIKVKRGIARGEDGQPLVSHEMVTVVTIEGTRQGDSMNVNLRGLAPVGFRMRGIKLAAGRMFETGKREAVVGLGVTKRYPNVTLGSELDLGRAKWLVVGIMDAGMTAYNSEIFVDCNLVSMDFQRPSVLSSVLLRVEPGYADNVKAQLLDERRLNVDVTPEIRYYADQTSAAIPIQFMGSVVAIIMGAGSVLSAMNTMFAAVARRSREIGTLRTLGFSRAQILLSFLTESLILSGLGGIAGILLVLPLRNWSTSAGSFTTFSEMAFQFQFTPAVIAAGFVSALTMGAIGGMIPAASAARKEILTALKS